MRDSQEFPADFGLQNNTDIRQTVHNHKDPADVKWRHSGEFFAYALLLFNHHALHLSSLGRPLLSSFSWAMKMARTKVNQEMKRARHDG